MTNSITNNTFHTIATFSYPTDLIGPRLLLESEGIECFVKDELTVATNVLFSNAIGGIKLQVESQNIERAQALLIESGYLKNEPPLVQPKIEGIINWLENSTAKIPLLGRLSFNKRVFIIPTLLVVIPSIIIYVASIPTSEEFLIGRTWALVSVMHNNEEVILLPPIEKVDTLPRLHLYLGFGLDAENWKFAKGGYLVIDMENADDIFGEWHVNNEVVRISDFESNVAFLNGTYEFKRHGNKTFTLKSDHVWVHAVEESVADLLPF